MSAPRPQATERIDTTDHHRLPDPADRAWKTMVADVRRQLADTGCSVLPDFVRPDIRDLLRAEGEDLAAHAHDATATVNAYNTDPDPALPADHPAQITVRRGNSFVPRDRIPADTVIARLYADEPFQRFIADCFGLDRLHELADPLAGLCLNVVKPGMEHPWHFDTNEFTVSLLTRAPDAGGAFEYCPRIRTATEENFDDVRDVLRGDAAHLVRRLTLRPGDLQLFQGRYALHRVARVTGTTARHTAIFAYSERPGVVGSAARTRQLFGRVLPEHRAAERSRVDALLD